MLRPEDLDKLRELFEIDGNVIHEAFQNALESMERQTYRQYQIDSGIDVDT